MKKTRVNKYHKREIKTRRGVKMLKGQWTLISPNLLEFPATLIETLNEDKVRIAIFRVPKDR